MLSLLHLLQVYICWTKVHSDKIMSFLPISLFVSFSCFEVFKCFNGVIPLCWSWKSSSLTGILCKMIFKHLQRIVLTIDHLVKKWSYQRSSPIFLTYATIQRQNKQPNCKKSKAESRFQWKRLERIANP